MVDQVLFKFKEYVQLWQTGGIAPNTNEPMIQYNTKIYKGATNVIDFVVRNNDRKPVNLAGYQISAAIQRVEQPELLLQKSVVSLDDKAGKARLTFAPIDIQNLLAGYYTYSIILTDVTGRDEFLYTDINRSTTGSFELIEGIEVALSPAIEITAADFIPVNDGYLTYHYVSGALPGDAQAGRTNGMHTVVAYTSNGFLGWLKIQASLTVQPPTDTDWFDIQLTENTSEFTYTPTNTPAIQAFNFTGNYYWIRALYKNDAMNQGSFDKVLYKN
jgi:hypothetical protein